MKFVINDCYGGYSYSQDFLNKYGEEIGSLERNDPNWLPQLRNLAREMLLAGILHSALKKFLTMLLTTPSRSMMEQRA